MLKLPCTKWQQRDETTEYERDRIEEKQLCTVIFNFLQGSFKGLYWIQPWWDLKRPQWGTRVQVCLYEWGAAVQWLKFSLQAQPALTWFGIDLTTSALRNICMMTFYSMLCYRLIKRKTILAKARGKVWFDIIQLAKHEFLFKCLVFSMC